MIVVPLLNEDNLDLVVSYTMEKDEEVLESILSAFEAARIRVYDRPDDLLDWVDPDVFDDIRWTSDWPVYFSTEIWDYRVVVTNESVRIYDP